MSEGDSDTPLRPGQRIDDYVLLRLLGRGGQAEVWEADDLALRRRVAIKVVTVGSDAKPTLSARFHREAEAVARLDHPHILAIHRLLERDGRLLLVQELLTGGNLDERLAIRRQDGSVDVAHVRWATQMVRDLARGLAHAHDHGVIHRDIKPANVLFTGNGTAKLADFGIARLADAPALSHVGAILGTPRYMSPEQVLSRPTDARTDVWGLGGTLYEALTLRPAFPGADIHAVMDAIKSRSPPAPRSLQPSLPADLEAVCLRCLETAPQDRYATAIELADDLDRFLDDEPTRARPAGPLRRALLALRRLPTSALGLAVLLVAAAWLLVDRMELRPLADREGSSVLPRFSALMLAAALGAWPLAVLARRLARGMRRAAWLALPILVALAWWPARGILADRSAYRHGEERASLEARLQSDPDSAFRESGAYAATWDGDLDGADFLVLAQAALEAEHPVQAEVWSAHWVDHEPGSPEAWALHADVLWTLGRDDDWRAAEDRLAIAAAPVTSSDAWHRIGQIHVIANRLGEALEAFNRAANPAGGGVHRDLLDVNLTEVRAALCLRGEAVESLAALQRNFKDVATRRLGLRVALLFIRAGEDVETWTKTAREVLDQLATDSTVALYVVFEEELAFARAKSDPEAVPALLEEWKPRCAGDPDLEASVAQAYYQLADYSEAMRLYEELRAMAPSLGREDIEVAALTNLSAVALLQGKQVDAERFAADAVAADGDSWSARYNLGVARQRRHRAEYGLDDTKWPPSVWIELAGLWTAAAECHGRQPKVLNNLAYSLAAVAKASGDPADVERARSAADRAVRLVQGDAASNCPRDENGRKLLSQALDTRRFLLHKVIGNYAAALDDARAASAALLSGDPRYDERKAVVSELEALVISPSAPPR